MYQKIESFIKTVSSHVFSCLFARVFFCRYMAGVPEHSIVFFPVRENMLCCGLAAIVAFKQKNRAPGHIDLTRLQRAIAEIEAYSLTECRKKAVSFDECYLGGRELISSLNDYVRSLKDAERFVILFGDTGVQAALAESAAELARLIDREAQSLSENMGYLGSRDVDIMAGRIEDLRDIAWCISTEVLGNVEKIQKLAGQPETALSAAVVTIYKEINAVLNSIDRLEVRGRDSAGISLLFVLEGEQFKGFTEVLAGSNLTGEFDKRLQWNILTNNCISLHTSQDPHGAELTSLTFVYKIAAEIGSLGDNVAFLCEQIAGDAVLQALVGFPLQHHSISAHTRWASVGAITEANCHPVDNEPQECLSGKRGIIHVCLNGDIDNFQQLKAQYESSGDSVPGEITTDTKIIPLHISKYLKDGHKVQEAFRLAVCDFEGSHAISMHTDLAPGKMFLAQKGSGQAVFVGMAGDHYMPTSEVYGFVEETPYYLKLDGEKVVAGKDGETQGQIFVLDQLSGGGLAGLKAMFYDGTPLELTEKDIQHTEITSRDIDRQEFPHYFLKEISESPVSVEKTLQNRWKITDPAKQLYEITLDERVVPAHLQEELVANRIRRIFFVGQGTAGVAALACANILNYYINDAALQISSLKSSELSGFKLDDDNGTSMADTLTIAITQSGTTTDTNRTVDMLRERGGRTIAIVNRRDSDITFKVDGVMYTSSGRDVEMSVASTKAFYSQIVAGALLGLYIARLKGCRDDEYVTREIKQLLDLPAQMCTVIAGRAPIEQSARRLATSRTYWAAVGSGPNKASADEIRIKLSELCYKTISTDYVEDKKHIDLSSEPLILICAAGTRDTVIGDIIKDTAIFQAHKAAPVVIADEGEDRFDLYAEDVFHVPAVGEHLAPIINTLVGHLWGYYAALAIHEGSRFMYAYRQEIQDMVDDYSDQGLDVYEVVLEKSFREKIAHFYTDFRKKKAEDRFPAIMGIEAAANLTLLLKYLSGRLPMSDFELDFGKTGTPLNMLNTLFKCLGEAINCMIRPVDAIKHQAKTVTVGTSRISEKTEGILFDALAEQGIMASQIINKNIIVLRNLQGIVSHIKGSTLYRINNLNLLGEPTDETTIEVVKKTGELSSVSSRVEKDNRLQGTKRIIAQEGNVYIGKGLKDDRSILVVPGIPVSSASPRMVEYMLLLHIAFADAIDLVTKKKALGGKYERIKNIVQEKSVEWEDHYLDLVAVPELFGSSAEKLGEFIATTAAGQAS